jgi:hypothetical protein
MFRTPLEPAHHATSCGRLLTLASRWARISSLTGLSSQELQVRAFRTAARSCYEEGLAVRRAAGDALGIAWALLAVGHAAWLQGDSVVAETHAAEALLLFQKWEHNSGLLTALENLAVAALARGRKEHAARLLGAVEALLETPGLPRMVRWCHSREQMGEANGISK